MKPKFLFPVLLPMVLAFPVAADTFTLKDGTTIEGKIISEADGVYTIDAVVGKGIKDELKVPKADVTKIDKEEADEKAFKALSKLLPAPDLLSAEEYTQSCNALESFLKSYPTSASAKDAKAMLQSLKAESTEIAAGSLKLNGKIISPAEQDANRYDIDARVREAKIRNLVNQGQTLAALRAFSEFCHDYRSTSSFTKLSPMMKQVMQNHLADTRELLATVENRITQRQAGLARMSPEDRHRTESAIIEEDAEIEARYKSEKAAKQDWVTPGPYHKASLEDTVHWGETELTRLASVKPTLGGDGGQAYHNAWELIHNNGSQAAVSAAIAAAKTAGVPASYITTLDTEAKAMAKQNPSK